MSGGVVGTAEPGPAKPPQVTSLPQALHEGVGGVELEGLPASQAGFRVGAPGLRVWLGPLDVGGGGMLPAPPG